MIEAKGISFYRGSNLVLTDLSFKLEIGEMVLLSGPNGVGKSTLVDLISGLLKPSHGSIQAANISVAPQRRNFSLAFPVRELLMLLPAKKRSFNTDLIIRELQLEPHLGTRVTELSAGEQQRVSLAIALVQEADFYLLDEPFSAQDSQSVKRILNLLNELKSEKGVLVVSHNAENLRPRFDREIILA